MEERFKELIKQARDLDHDLFSEYGFRINLFKEFRTHLEEGAYETRMVYFNPWHLDLRDGLIRFLYSYRMVYVKKPGSDLFVELDSVEQDILQKVRDVTQLSEDFQ